MKHLAVLLLVIASITYAVPEGGCSPSGTQLFPCSMVRYSTPIKVSAALGVVFMKFCGYNEYTGFFVQAEPGFAGGKLNLGYRYGGHRFIPLFNIGLSASLMQTWDNPLNDVEGGQTYVGLELSGALSFFGVNFGVFRHVAGDDDEHQWIYTLGVGGGI
jgi:hypothetical protein